MSSKKRERARQRPYIDGMDSDSDNEPIPQTFNVDEKLKQFPQYLQYFIKELRGDEVTLSYFQRHGFNVPILVREPTGLGMKIPSTNFTVTDVKNLVGARRTVDVMDCTTQANSEMTMKEWEEYYYSENRTRKLNVISLEFSHTKLEHHVTPPLIVRQIDWTDNIWPRHLKDQQTEGTNDLRFMKYPKVQRYCLMSVKGCYTDFHIDFGGTSVWYHILKGKKVFWLIPPTETNLKSYEQWTLSGKQGDIFFGDLVEKCGTVNLEAGNTFFIPSGWIHAVYTPEDSIVFGGNFLHSFSIEKQIRVAQIEEVTKVPHKFRFPFFTELQWYALDKYVYALLGRTHLNLEDEVMDKLLGTREEREEYINNLNHPHITPQELFGLKAIVMFIHALAVTKKNIPELLTEPINLVRDIRLIVDQHKDDDLEKAVTGKQLLYWPGIKKYEHSPKHRNKSKAGGSKGKSGYLLLNSDNKRKNESSSSPGSKKKHERVPCKICQACISPNCGNCEHCTDMSRRLKKLCLLRQCLQPLLHPSLTCLTCGLDGWYAEPNMRLIDRPPGTCALMECVMCYELQHPSCLTDYGVHGYALMNKPSSWECPKCVKIGKGGIKRESEQESNVNKALKTEGDQQQQPQQLQQQTPQQQQQPQQQQPKKKPISSGSDANYSGYQLFSVKGRSDQPKQTMRLQLAEQILSASTHEAKLPSYVFRPPPVTLKAEDVYERRKRKETNLSMEPVIMLPIFQRLTTTDLSQCALVCKTWNTIIQDPSLWYTVKLSHKKITSHLLSLIVQRQPTKLVLDWCNVNKQQLSWLLPRIPQTKSISLCGLDFHNSVVALNTVNSPMLQELDISYVSNFNDSSLYKILSSPPDSRPGLLDKKSRQKLLRKLCLSGTEISDVSLRYITQFLSQLNALQISSCWKVSDAGLAQLAMCEKTRESLVSIDISMCKMITNQGLLHLSKCKNLTHIDCTNSGITTEGMKKFLEERKEEPKLKIYGFVIDRKLSKK